MRKHYAWKLILLTLAQLATVQTLRAQSPSVFTVRGEAHDSSGQKVGCARVCAMPEKPVSGEFFPCAITTADGKFLIQVEKAGNYRLVSDRTEEGYMSQYLPFYKQPAVPVPEIVLDGDNANHYVQINLGPKAGMLTGKIVDAATGRPVEDAKLILCHAAAPAVCFETGAKNVEGKFSVRAPHVPFTLKIVAEGFMEHWLGLDVDSAVVIDPGTTMELPVYLTRQKGAEGRAVSEAEKVAGMNLPAPAVLSPADNVVFDHYPRKTRLEWKAVEGAASYALEVDYCMGWRPGGTDCPNPQPLNMTVTSISSTLGS